MNESGLVFILNYYYLRWVWSHVCLSVMTFRSMGKQSQKQFCDKRGKKDVAEAPQNAMFIAQSLEVVVYSPSYEIDNNGIRCFCRIKVKVQNNSHHDQLAQHFSILLYLYFLFEIKFEIKICNIYTVFSIFVANVLYYIAEFYTV